MDVDIRNELDSAVYEALREQASRRTIEERNLRDTLEVLARTIPRQMQNQLQYASSAATSALETSNQQTRGQRRAHEQQPINPYPPYESQYGQVEYVRDLDIRLQGLRVSAPVYDERAFQREYESIFAPSKKSTDEKVKQVEVVSLKFVKKQKKRSPARPVSDPPKYNIYVYLRYRHEDGSATNTLDLMKDIERQFPVNLTEDRVDFIKSILPKTIPLTIYNVDCWDEEERIEENFLKAWLGNTIISWQKEDLQHTEIK